MIWGGMGGLLSRESRRGEGSLQAADRYTRVGLGFSFDAPHCIARVVCSVQVVSLVSFVLSSKLPALGIPNIR